jgi:SAM-dependent methyltransferase
MTPENAPTLYDRGAYEKFESSAADMHDHLVRVLGVRENERWIDVATGAGAIALRAARLGADVTGQDLSSRLIRIAAEKAASAGLSVRFEIGDCQQLPDRDEWYDVVSSSVGAMYAPDHRAVARQLARVLRKGGRLGLTAWRLEGGRSRWGSSRVGSFLRHRKVQPHHSIGGGLTMYESCLATIFSSSSKKVTARCAADLPNQWRKSS